MKPQPSLLIVDDEQSNLQKLKRTFINDFQIFKAQSGEEALALLQDQVMDVIITDQKMAGMSGVGLLSESLALSPEAIRIILTGYTEVDDLMGAINQGQVHRYITKPWQPFALRQTVLQDLEHFELKRQNQLLREQLRIAKKVQSHLFPQALPAMELLDYGGTCRAAGQVGGDYYDFLQLSPTLLCIAVGDISGKGISAALLMASLQALLRSHAPNSRGQLSEMLGDINRLLCSMTDDSRFSTFFCGVFDSQTSCLTYANAGHNPPLLLRASSRPEADSPGAGNDHPVEENFLRLEPTGTLLGIFSDSQYEQRKLKLFPDDLLVIYTDGIIEAQNPLGEHFGERRLERLVATHRHCSAQELQGVVLAEVARFSKGAEILDDLTLVVVRVRSGAGTQKTN
ncbi:MAG: SpoIIE family protein phosphatase [Acidobacteriota bacterium]